jgi:CheY-like chemotaxis protein
MRVLLIEDDVWIAQSITEALEAEGFHVDETDRGEDGLELSDLYEYQVMILDLGLPDMRGDEVLQNLRQKTQACRCSFCRAMRKSNRAFPACTRARMITFSNPSTCKSLPLGCKPWCDVPMGIRKTFCNLAT